MPAMSLDTVALSQDIDRRIAAIKADPCSYHNSMFSGNVLSNGSKAEISSLDWLKALLGFVAGNTVSSGIFDNLSPCNMNDREWFIASIDVYLSQHRDNMACLLSEHIDTLNTCRYMLAKGIAA